jgi:hypothetical protein
LRPSGQDSAPKEAGRIACDRNEEEECKALAATEPTQGVRWPVKGSYAGGNGEERETVRRIVKPRDRCNAQHEIVAEEKPMPRRKKSKDRQGEYRLLMFEIKEWEPSYSFSLNREKYADTDYSEYAELHFQTLCIYPDSFAGRSASMILSSRKDLLVPPDPRRDLRDKPTEIGLLKIPPSGGNFYGGVPHETMSFLLSGLVAQRFRYMTLSGNTLQRSAFICTELGFQLTSD